MRRCRAKAKRSQERCQNPAMKGMAVCYHHGGSLGTKKARKARNVAALKHGYYTAEVIEERRQVSCLLRDCKRWIVE